MKKLVAKVVRPVLMLNCREVTITTLKIYKLASVNAKMVNVPWVSNVFNVRMVKPFLVAKVVVLVQIGIIVTIPVII